jgi:hypothetical protein
LNRIDGQWTVEWVEHLNGGIIEFLTAPAMAHTLIFDKNIVTTVSPIPIRSSSPYRSPKAHSTYGYMTTSFVALCRLNGD